MMKLRRCILVAAIAIASVVIALINVHRLVVASEWASSTTPPTGNELQPTSNSGQEDEDRNTIGTAPSHTSSSSASKGKRTTSNQRPANLDRRDHDVPSSVGTTNQQSATPARRLISSGSSHGQPLLGANLIRHLLDSGTISGGDSDNDKFCDKLRDHLWAQLPQFVSPALLRALQEQRRRHTLVQQGTPEPNQKYIVWSLSGGIGNRFLSLISTFVAAMLTQRVLLMKDWFTPLPPSGSKQIPVIINSPRAQGEYFLEDLSRLFDMDAATGVSRRANISMLLCLPLPMMQLSEFYRKYPHEFSSGSNGGKMQQSLPKALEEHIKVDVSARHDKHLRRWDRFLCGNLGNHRNDNSTLTSLAVADAPSTQQQQLQDHGYFFSEKFVYVWTNQYFLPGLFANPHVAPQLLAMFPQNMSSPYSTMIKILVLPGQPVMRRVESFFKRSGLRPGEYTGLHIRAFHRHVMTTLATSFDHCLSQVQRKGINNNNNNGGGDGGQHNNIHHTRFFLATMHNSVRSYFVNKYTTDTVASLAPPTDVQRTGNARFDIDALTDMIILSLAEEVLLSPRSTFGMFVPAFGGPPRPIRVNYENYPITSGSTAGVCGTLPLEHQPCFGSWFQRDHIYRRRAQLSCALVPIPEWVQHCN